MKFGFEQDFGAAPQDVLDVLIDPAFWSGIDDLSATSVPDVLDIDQSANSARVKLRYRLVVDLPSEAARFIDTSNVSWVEITEWDLRDLSSRTTFVPDQAGRLMTASADSTLRPSGDGSTRDITGDLRIRIPLLGSKVERAIIGGIGDHLAELTTAVDSFLG